MDLLVNVAQLLKEDVGATRKLAVDVPQLELEAEPPASVKGSLLLTHIDQGVWVTGPVAISTDSTCSRCLVPFTSWLQVELDDVFLPLVDPKTGARRPRGDDTTADMASIDDHHVLDLSEPLRQYRRAAMPLAPVCRDDCKGICAHCGADLNASTCKCTAAPDPRWASLRELLT